MTAPYTGPERRAKRHDGGAPVTNDDLDEALAVHSEQERQYVKGLIEEVLWAFPDGVEKHRAAHEAQIAAAKAQEEFWDTAKKALITNGVSGVFGLLRILFLLILLGLTVKFTMPEAVAKAALALLAK